jgi:cytochrome P450
MLRDSPIAALTEAHFEQPIVFTKTVLGPIAVVSDPAAIHRVLIENAANYRRERLQKLMMGLPFGTSLLAAEGDQWRNQRRRMAPGFTPRIVESFVSGTAAAASAVVERWMNFEDGSPHELDWELDRAMVDVLERTLFTDGLQGDPNELTRKGRLHYALVGKPSVLDILDMPAWIPRWTRLRHSPVHRFFARMAAATIEARERRLAGSRCAPPNDLMSVLLQGDDAVAGDALGRDEILANIFTVFAAVEPVATALIWTLYLLSCDPKWRERIEIEADRELPDGRYVEGSLQRLAATRAVIEESLRLYPPIATIHRQATAADELAGHAIAAETIVIISPWVVHRHRLLWEAPDLFDPSRFLPGARTNVDRFAYLPFGMGPRTCIGGAFGLQTAVILLATILRRFRLDVAPGHQVWPVLHVTLRPRGGLPMILYRRQ